MAAVFQWYESNGIGETQTADRTEANFKNIDDSTTVYTAAPIAVGNNSFSKWIFGRFSGTFNTISAGLWAHTVGVLGANLTLKGQPAMTADSDRLVYASQPGGQPAAAALTSLTFDQTPVILITAGRAVWFGSGGPSNAGKAASMTTNPCFTNYLTMQLLTVAGASSGDTTQITMALRYDEN